MMTFHDAKKSLLLALSGLFLLSGVASAQPGYTPSEEIKASQATFQTNRFGVFIHWGISSMLGQGEWVMNVQDLNYQEYAKLASGFYPSKFDAAKWVSDIKSSGAKYICLITRHHDGFTLFDSKYTDYDMVDATPFHRDVVKEIADECHKQGLAIHFYYSLIDWYRDDYEPLGNTGHGTGRPGKGHWKDYFEFMKGQITELLTNYGEVGCIWFDGNWDQENNPDFNWQYDELYSLIHKLQPSCLVGNNHHIDPIEGEDIQIFERDVPGENSAGWHKGGISALPLETCQTMNDSWGYRIKDLNYKSLPYLIKYMVSTAGRDANLLLNVGPQPNGEIPAAAVERLHGMGEWLGQYGETIYGTRSTLVPPQPWGVTTHKDNKMWLHVFPADLAASHQAPEIYIPYKNAPKIKSVSAYGNTDKLPFRQYKEGIFVTLPEVPGDVPDYVVEISFKD